MSVISNVTSILGGLGGGVVGGSRTSSGGTAGGGVDFGPAFSLGGSLGGGSSQSLISGLYDAFGQLQGVGQAVAPDPPPSKAELERAKTLQTAARKIETGDTAGGRADALTLLKIDKTDVGAIATVARSYFKEGNYDEAEKQYTRAVALAPSSARLRRDLSDTQILKKSDSDVVKVAEKKLASRTTLADGLRLIVEVTDRSPRNAKAFVALADGYAQLGNRNQSILALKEAADVAGGDDLEAITSRAREFVLDNPEIGLGHNILGRVLQKAGKLNTAVKELKTATELAPENGLYIADLADAYVARAAGNVEKGDLTTVQSDLNAAEAIDPANPNLDPTSARLASVRAESDLTAGRYTLAVSRLNQAFTKAPDDAAFRKGLSSQFLRAARHYEGTGDHVLAAGLYDKAYQSDPTSVFAKRKTRELSYAVGIEYRDAAEYASAITHLDRAYQLDRTNVAYRQDLAGVYDLRGVELEGQGDSDAAFTAYEKGYKLDPSNTSLEAHYFAALALQG